MNGLKTIYSRITTLEGSHSALEGIGVAMYQIGENGEQSLKPVNKILEDLGEKWGTLSSEQQQHIAVTLAGRYQLSRFLALMNNWDMATNATTTALTSQGSAMRENARFMESYEARINQMKNAFTAFSLSVGDKIMKSSLSLLIDGLTKLADVASTLVDTFGALPLAIGALGGLVAMVGGFKKPLTNLQGGLSGVLTQFKKVNEQQRNLQQANAIRPHNIVAPSSSAAIGAVVQNSNRQMGVSTAVTSTATAALGRYAAAQAAAGAATNATVAAQYRQIVSSALATAGTRVLSASMAMLATVMRTVLMASVIGAAFAGLGVIIEKVTAKMNEQRVITEEMEKNNKTLIDSYRNTEGGLEKLINQYDRLNKAVQSGEIKKGTTEYNEYVEVANRLAELMPTVVKYVDQSGLAHLRETDAMKEQLKYAEQLSEAKARMAAIEFDINFAEKMGDIGEQINKIKKLEEAMQYVEVKSKSQGKNSSNMGLLGGFTKSNEQFLRDTARMNFEIMQAEQSKQLIMQETLLLISDTSLAYLEADKKLKDLTDSGKALVEGFAQANDAYMREAIGDEAEFERRGAKILEMSVELGEVLADTKTKMLSGVKDPLQIEEITTNLDNMMDAIPSTFFSIENFKNIDEFKGKFEGLLEISDKVGRDEGTFNSLVADVEKYGFTTEEASGIVSNFAKQQENARLRTEAMAKQTENMGSEMADFTEETLEAVEAAAMLFNVGSEDAGYLLSHIDNMNMMTTAYGEAGKMQSGYLDSLEAMVNFTGLPPDVIQKDLTYFRNAIELSTKASLKYDEATGALVGFNREGLNNAQIGMLEGIIDLAENAGVKYDLLTGVMTDLSGETELAFNEQGDLVEVIRDANGLIQENPTNGQKAAIFQTGEEAKKTKGIIEDMTSSMDEYVRKTVEAIDVSSRFFGLSDSDAAAAKSQLEYLILTKRTYKENAKQIDEYKESLKAVAEYIGLPEAEVEKNYTYYYDMIELTEQLTAKRAEGSDSMVISTEGMTKTQKDMYAKIIRYADEYGVRLDVLNDRTYRLSDGAEVAITKQGKLVEVIRDANDQIIKEPTSGQKAAAEKATEAVRKMNAEVKNAQQQKMFNDADMSGEKVKNDAKEVVKANKEAQTEFAKTRIAKVFNEADMSGEYTKGQTLKVYEAAKKTREEFQRNKLEKLFNDTDTSAEAVVVKADKVSTASSIARTEMTKTRQEKMFNEADMSAETVVKKVEKVKSTIEQTIQKMKEAKQQKLFEDAGMEGAGKGGVNNGEAKVSALAEAIRKATESASILTSLNDAVVVTTGKVNTLTSNMVKVAEHIGKITTAIVSLKNMALAIGEVADATNRYTAVVQASGTNIGLTYGTSANIVGQMTRFIIEQNANHTASITASTSSIKAQLDGQALKWSQLAAIIGQLVGYLKDQYGKNSVNVAMMVTGVKSQLDRMVGDFGVAGSSLITVMGNTTTAMHKTYLSGILEIVKASETLPERIGAAIRRNIGSATGAMDELAKGMVSRFKKELGIHSPSRVFESLGGWVIKGLTNGLSGGNLVELGKNVFEEFGGEAYRNIDMIKDHLTFNPEILGSGFAGFRRTSGFGRRKSPGNGIGSTNHMGVDYAAPYGTPIPAKVGGKVVASGFQAKRGNYVRIRGSNGMEYIYQHNARNSVRVGDTVRRGQIIGAVGSTGASTGNHLHFEVLVGGRPVNPERFGFKGFARGGLIKNDQVIRVGEEDKEEMIIPLEQHKDRAVSLWKQAGERLGQFEHYATGGTVGKKTTTSKTPAKSTTKTPETTSYVVKAGDTLGKIAGQFKTTVKSLMELNKTIKNANSLTVGQKLTVAGKAGSKTTSKKTTDKKKEKKVELTEAYQVDKYERAMTKLNTTIGVHQAKLAGIKVGTDKYRKAVAELNNLDKTRLNMMNQELKRLEARNVQITATLKKMPPLNKQNEKLRQDYNRIQQEFDSNATTIQSMKAEVITLAAEISAVSKKIFEDMVSEIVTSFERATKSIQDRVDNLDFKMSVLELTDPDNIKLEGELQAQRLDELKKLKYQQNNEYARLQEKLFEAVRKWGSQSDIAQSLKEQVRTAEDAVQNTMLQILQTEKAIRDMRGEVADNAIDKIKDYYGKMKDLAIDAKDNEIEQAEKAHDAKIKMIDDEIDRASKAHDAKMKLYDEEIERINAVYDAKIRSLDDAESEDQYQEQLQAMNKDKVSLMDRIALLSRNSDPESRKKLAELQKELTDKQKEINDHIKTRQRELLKQQLEDQKEKQIEEIEQEKETQEEIHESLVERLEAEKEALDQAHDQFVERINAEKEAITKHYDSIINDEQRWATLRSEMMKGNFTLLEGELALMQASVSDKNSAIFAGLASDFAAYMSTVKQQIADLKAIQVNTNTGYQDAINQGNSDGSDKVKTKGRLTTGLFTKKATADALLKEMKGHNPLASKVMAVDGGYRIVMDFDSVDRANTVLAYQKKKGNMSTGYVTAFDTGGYTGDNEGLAWLDKKEIVFNENETENIFKTVKLVESMKDTLPLVQASNMKDKMKAVEGITNNITNTYNLTVNVTANGGAKDIANQTSKVVLNNLRKNGRR